MATFTYPTNDYDNPTKLLGLLGSFWATTYQGLDFVENTTAVLGQAAQQSYTQLLEVVNSVSRFDVPLYHRENWYALTIRESEINQDKSLIEKYARTSGNVYGNDNNLQYGVIPSQSAFSVSKPEGLEDAKAIFNRLVSPSVQLVKSLDYEIRDAVISFRDNPFENPLIPKVDILSAAGEPVDRECVLWVYRGQWDWDYVYEQFGYALQLRLKTSQGYKDFINAVLDAFVQGTSANSQQQAISAIFGSPLAVENEETVQEIREDNKHLNVITDQHVYQYPKGANAVVTIGEVVSGGSALTDVLQVFELNRGESLPASQVPALAAGSGLLAYGYYGDLTFFNEEENTVVEEDEDGYTKISWRLGGYPASVEKFWDDVHDNGVVAGETLAMLLDSRENPVGQPTADSLPATVNSLQFLADNILRNNAFIVKVRVIEGSGGGLDFVPAAQLRKIHPPHTLMLIIVELDYSDAPVIMDGPGTEEKPGYEEQTSGYPVMVAAETLDQDTYLAENVKLRQINGRCI